VILVVVVVVWGILLIAFVVLSAAVRGTRPRARTKPSDREEESEISDEQFGAG
jgi:hypothetical protein